MNLFLLLNAETTKTFCIGCPLPKPEEAIQIIPNEYITVSNKKQRNLKTASHLVVSCIDFRIIDEVVRFLMQHGLTDCFDHLVVPGASLSTVLDSYSNTHGNWSNTTLEQIEVMINLHDIKTVLLFDHIGCCMHKVVFGKQSEKDEFSKHIEIMKKAAEKIKGKNPNVAVRGWIIDFEGRVWDVTENIKNYTQRS